MARQITIAFAENGNRDSIPVTVQLNGEVSWAEGYGFDYQRPIGSSPLAKNVERTKQNALFHDITEILRQYQQQGAPEWYPDTPYAQFARVKHEGNYYVALVDETEQEPGTGGDWAINNVAAQVRQNNLTATADPTVDDDETEGYEPLSQWINTSSGEIFIAISVAAGAANWQQGTLTVNELGNAALANVTATPTSTTPGAVMKTGDAGWLGLVTTGVTDLNSYTVSGAYQLPSGSPGTFSNAPSGAEPSRSALLVLGNMSPYGAQIYIDRTLNRFWTRSYSSGFMAWREAWTTGNTSANVQTMLGSADNAAIRSNIGAAKRTVLRTVSASSHNFDAVDDAAYHRFTFSGAKTATVRPNSTHALPSDYAAPIRNSNTGNLTIVAGSGVTINPGLGGTLVLEPGMAATLFKVGTNEYDLIGQTVPA